jgi:quercetin dioxygenase-like cupin family protein
MIVQRNTPLQATPFPGIEHSTLARRGSGLEALSVWKQTIAPGLGTPPHRHTCEEVVVVLEGEGELALDGELQAFGPGSILVLPANVDHRIMNTGRTPLTIVATFSASPVATMLPDGAALELPWVS